MDRNEESSNNTSVDLNNGSNNGCTGGEQSIKTSFQEKSDSFLTCSDFGEEYNSDLNREFNVSLDDQKYNSINLMLTNARSLSSKILSLLEYFEEMKLDIAIITESWLADGAALESNLVDLEYGTDLKVVYKNRPVKRASRRRTAGGGVALIYNKNRCNFKERRIVGNCFEAVCMRGKVGSLEREVIVMGIYICLLYTSPSPRDLSTSRMPSSA